MIKYTENISEIIKLWKNAFGDTEEEIAFFADNLKHGKCLAYYNEGEIASMMYIVECLIDGEKSHYIYAACTFSELQSRGFMTELIEYAKSEYSSLCLIPASDSLVFYYHNRGINKKIPIESITFNETAEIKEYLYEGYDLSEPVALMYKGE